LSEINHIETTRPSEKSFGIVFAAVFILIALYPQLEGGGLRLWALGIAFFFFVVAHLAPDVLVLPNKLWFTLGIALGSVVAPIVMGIVYFTTVLPVGLTIRLVGKDLLHQKLNVENKSYWIKREQPISTMKDQF
jgi:hypothetical protein